jgi:putative transposase
MALGTPHLGVALTRSSWETARWVDWYNHRRLHGGIGGVPPAEHEELYWQGLAEAPEVA